MKLSPKTGTLRAVEETGFEMEIVPDLEAKKAGGKEDEQEGELLIYLQGDPTDNKETAHIIAGHAGEQISFFHGQLNLVGGFVSAERIPETEEERQLVGEKKFLVEMQIQEVRPPKLFDPATFGSTNLSDEARAALRQFNAARASKNPIDRFLGYFKTLEQLGSTTSSSRKAVNLIGDSEELYSAAQKVLMSNGPGGKIELTRENFRSLAIDLLKMRDQCAHLQTRHGTGVLPGDSRAQKELEPLLHIIQDVAFEAIKARIGNSGNSDA